MAEEVKENPAETRQPTPEELVVLLQREIVFLNGRIAGLQEALKTLK